jgi:sugar porter (SP) family MFS transporter
LTGATEERTVKRTLMGSTIIAALGGLLFGFDTAVISGAEGWLEEVYDLDRFWLGFTVAAALIGTIVGAVVAGRPADVLGRRATLIVVAVLYFVSAIGSALAWDWYSLLLFRFLGGIGVGGASVVSPMYIAEISPARLRGRLVAVTQFNIVLGILLAQFSNFLIAQFHLGAAEWRWMFGVEALPAAAFFFLLFLVPRSPRWLVGNNELDEARSVLSKTGTDTGDVETELEEIQKSLHFERQALREPFFQKKYSKPILLAFAIAMFNQLSGINAILYYAPRIFAMSGAGESSALLQAVAVGFTNLIFTILAMAVIDYFGRKRLMIAGSIGYILSLAAVAGTFYVCSAEFEAVADATKALGSAQQAAGGAITPAVTEARAALDAAMAGAAGGGTVVLIGLMVFIASHAFGQGAVIWVFISEIFPNRVRARGQALGSLTHWAFNAAISWTFPMVAALSGAHVFAFYAAMMVLQLLWVLLIMPETKGVPLEEIQKKLGIE